MPHQEKNIWYNTVPDLMVLNSCDKNTLNIKVFGQQINKSKLLQCWNVMNKNK